jgi:heptosyltransferase II
VNLAERHISSILVRGTNWVGDALLTIPALDALHDNFPQATISVLVKPWVAPVYAHHPAVHDIIVFERQDKHRGFSGLVHLAADIKTRGFELAVLFQNAFQAGLIAWLAGIPLRLGYNTDGRRLLLRPSVKLTDDDKKIHETEYYLRLLARAGLKTPLPKNARPKFHLADQNIDLARKRLMNMNLDKTFLLGIAPGAAYGTAKQWPARKYAAAADMILQVHKGSALIFGSIGEAAVAANVKNHMKYPALNLAGETNLAEAAALIDRCDLFLTNDSGLMHVAAAVNTPLVAVFGSTNPQTTSPRSEWNRIIRRPVECAPCMKPKCTQAVHRCMELIVPEDVALAGLNLLRQKGGT